MYEGEPVISHHYVANAAHTVTAEPVHPAVVNNRCLLQQVSAQLGASVDGLSGAASDGSMPWQRCQHLHCDRPANSFLVVLLL